MMETMTTQGEKLKHRPDEPLRRTRSAAIVPGGLRASLLPVPAAAAALVAAAFYCCCTMTLGEAATAASFREPQRIHGLDVVITLGQVTMTTARATLTTRALNGSVPGGTVHVFPGDDLRVTFRNDLSAQPGARKEVNAYQTPDTSNLHWHGAHVSSRRPGDDAKLVVAPGESYEYTIEVPEDHMPGTHWIHPHHHGSTALQVGGGAAMAFIVKDPPGYLPADVASAKDVVWVVQQFDVDELESISALSGDGLFAAKDVSVNYFMTVNGVATPEVRMAPYEWQRWRIVFAGWLGEAPLGFKLPSSCDMYLLAKDGIYIDDYPRQLSSAEVPIGGRADLMVRCPPGGGGDVTAQDAVLATILLSGAARDNTELSRWGPREMPSYLKDLRDTEATEGCSCPVDFDGDNAVNGVRYTGEYMHTSFIGAIVERTLQGVVEHPYHQHTYPFQLISAEGGNRRGNIDMSEWNHIGDWQDTYQGGSAIVRYKTTKFSGSLMFHCHRLKHEDRGMMALENIYPKATAECTCYQAVLPWWGILSIFGGLCLFGFFCALLVRHRRRAKGLNS